MTGDRRWWEAGFSAEEEAQWSIVAAKLIDEYDFTPGVADLVRVASRWRIAGFTPDEAMEWRNAMCNDSDWEFLAQTAREWRDAGFSADEAWDWSRSWPMPGETPEYAALFRDNEWHPFHVWLLYSLCDGGYQGDWDQTRRDWALVPWVHALNCARAGMSPQEAMKHLDLPRAELEQELRRRYALRVPVDPYVAMHVNHHIWMAYGEDKRDDVPFYVERLWDLHNKSMEEDLRAGRIPQVTVPHAIKPSGGVTGPLTSGPKPAVCGGSGGTGRMVEYDGWDEWLVVCPECGGKWAGGPVSPLPEHTR